LPGQGVADAFSDPNHPDVRPAFERIGEPMVAEVHGGHHRHIPPEQLRDRFTEGGRGELHLAQLVHDDHSAGPGCAQCRERDPLEGCQVHAVPADPWRARQVDVGEGSPRSGDGLDREALPAPAGA
jgi:hypothetical protein